MFKQIINNHVVKHSTVNYALIGQLSILKTQLEKPHSLIMTHVTMLSCVIHQPNTDVFQHFYY